MRPSTMSSRSSPDPGRKRTALGSGWCAGLLIALLLGCAPDSPPPPPPPALEEGYEGVSPEEMVRQAEPMTPEEAERLGIVDTTIRMESPIGPDSLVEFDGSYVVPIDTVP